MKPRNKVPQIPFRQVALWIVSFIILVILFSKFGDAGKVKNIDYSAFKAKIASGDLLDVTITPELITGVYKDDGKKGYKEHHDYLIPLFKKIFWRF